MKTHFKPNMDGYHLKLLAIVFMIIDHGYKIFLIEIVDVLSSFLPMEVIFFLVYIGFGFTRIAFPIFAFLIAEGCRYTKHKGNYLLRLFLFGCISEIPFQYMICILKEVPMQLSFGLTNVYFTLLLGAVAIFAYDYFHKKGKLSYLSLLPLFSCVGLSYLLNCDYGIFGPLMIFVCYYYRSKKQKFWALGVVITIYSMVYLPVIDIMANGFSIAYFIIYITDWIFSLISIILLSKYNGTRGKSIKYFFYLFYPVHISILLGIYYLMGNWNHY